MAFDKLEFAPNQMRGIYDYAGLRAMVSSVASPATDVKRTRDLEKLSCDPEVRASADSVTMTLSECAAQSLMGSIAQVCAKPIDTTNPVMWLHLREAVVCANRLICTPNLDCGEDVSVHDMLIAVSTLLDVAFRLTDSPESAEASGEMELRRRCASIYVDLCVGRGCAWVSFIDDVGCEAALLRDASWVKLRDEYASRQVQIALSRIARIREGADEAACARIWSADLLSMAAVFDERQRASCKAALGRPFVDLDDDVVVAAANIEVMAEVADALAEATPEAIDADGLMGWCRAFRMPPTDCVCSIPTAFSKSARDSYMRAVAKRASERLARAGVE